VNDDRTRIAVRGSAVSIGTELNQTYCIDSLLGVGGMGEVFKGHNIQTGDPVAIKIVLPEFAQDETILNLFRKEARILNHLNHEAIVRYYVFSIDPTLSRPYLAMEYVDGPSLAAHIRNAALAASEFMPLLRRLADGLHRAHLAGVIHRDISPDNVILPGGLVQNAKIIDFGIARSANVGGETLLGGSFAGKYNFVSPEQLGLYGGEVTPKSDIYSLALVMAGAMRGRPLDMGGSQVDVIEKRRSVPDLTGVPKQFHPVLSAMLLPDPAKRPADMAAIRDWPDVQPGPRSKAEKPKAVVSKVAETTLPRPSNALRNGVFAIAVVSVMGLGALGGWIYTQRDMPSNGGKAPAADSQTPPSGGGSEQATGPKPAGGETPTSRTEPQASSPPGGATSQATEPKPTIDDRQAKVELQTPTPPAGDSGQAVGPKPPGDDRPLPKVEPQTSPPPGGATPQTAGPKPATDARQASKIEPQTSPPPGGGTPQTTGSKLPGNEEQATKVEPQAPPPGAGSPQGAGAKTSGGGKLVAKAEPPIPEQTGIKPSETAAQGVSPGVTQPKSQGGSASQQAALPNPILPPVLPPSTTVMKDFVTSFGADNCFAAMADNVTATSAAITALGTAEASRSFTDAFRQKAGFAPSVTLDPVSTQQCEFVGSLRRMSVSGAAPLNIVLSKPEIRGGDADTGALGDPLTVTVTGGGERNIYLFVMDHKGGVQNINRLCASCITMKTGEIEAGLSLFAPAKVEGESRPPFYPMLVFAVASPRPLISINSQDAFEAEDFIAPFLKEITGSRDVTTAVGFLKLRDQ